MSSHPRKIDALVETPRPITARPSLSRMAQKRLLRIGLIALDAVVLAFGFLAAHWVRFGLQVGVQLEAPPANDFYQLVVTFLIPVWLVLFWLFGLYEWDNLLGGTSEYRRLFNACTTGILMVVGATFLEPHFVISRGWLMTAWFLTVVLLSVSRFLLRRAIYALRNRGYFLAPTVVIGLNGEALALCRQLMDLRSSGLRIVGVANGALAEIPPEFEELGLPFLGSVDEIEPILLRYEIEEVIIAVTALDKGEMFSLYEKLSAYPSVRMRISSGAYEILTTGVEVRTIGFVPLMTLSRIRLDPVQYAAKTIVDYTLTLLGLVLAFPLMGILAMLVKLDSPGPVFHLRQVVGVGARRFNAFKLRTMFENGDQMIEQDSELGNLLKQEHKLRKDPRVTRVGYWLRRFSLDELPQLFNVLLGQMSLVGPRMISPEEELKYGKHRLNLLTVKPGITGLWQVSGRSDLSHEDRVRLDMHYIRNYTIWRDLQILLVQTPKAVLLGKGAY